MATTYIDYADIATAAPRSYVTTRHDEMLEDALRAELGENDGVYGDCIGYEPGYGGLVDTLDELEADVMF